MKRNKDEAFKYEYKFKCTPHTLLCSHCIFGHLGEPGYPCALEDHMMRRDHFNKDLEVTIKIGGEKWRLEKAM